MVTLGDLTDENLVSRAVTRDDTAFEKLLERYTPIFRSIPFKMISNKTDAEDAFQEGTIRLWGGLPTYNPLRPFVYWGKAIYRRAAVDCLRKTISIGRRYSNETDLLPHHSPGGLLDYLGAERGNEDNTEEKKATLKLLQEAIISGDGGSLALHFQLRGARYKIISRVMQTCEGSLKSRIHYAKKGLREAASRKKIMAA